MTTITSSPLSKLLPALREKGIDSVSVTYSGSGDDGYVDSPVLKKGADEIKDDELQKDIFNAFEQLLDEQYGGWENNDGGSGEFIINVKTGKADWRHESNFTSSNTTKLKVRL